MTTPFGPNTRRWSILPFSLWSHDGQTRLNLHPCDRNEPAGAWSTSPAAPPGGSPGFYMSKIKTSGLIRRWSWVGRSTTNSTTG
jgi:hypothetical protein